jgi:hypothetical protein
MHGNSVKKIQIRNQVNGEDLVPTILEIIKMPVPNYCTGKILEEVLW